MTEFAEIEKLTYLMQVAEVLELKNQTVIKEFILLGFKHLQNIRIILLLVFLIIYIMTIAGNILIVILVVADRHLHTPMYFFLGNLSCLESFYTSAILPRMLASFLSGDRSISVNGCFVQHYFFAYLAAVECYLLSAMSYDRYLAICKPLHYVTMMNGKLCLQLIAISWISGTFASSLIIIIMSKLAFCASNTIDHYFCDTLLVIELSCSDSSTSKLLLYIVSSIVTFPPFTLTLMTYVYIIATIMKIPSTTGKQKAFSTCSSHLLVVTIFYGTLMSIYAIPNTIKVSGLHKVFSIIYTILTPMLNPIIYSLRNKEVKVAFKRLMSLIFVQIHKKSKFGASLV
ncbi:olfactory receptor 2AP1-like [Liasis olivaceus]